MDVRERPEPAADATEAARTHMVSTQLRRRGIRDEAVLRAMEELPREEFLEPSLRQHAYDDAALPIESGQSISQPYMVARMTELLGLKPGDRVLEVGTGSGYQAAVLAMLGASVVSFERFPDLAEIARRRLSDLGLDEHVEIRAGDGSLGDPDGGSYDGIIVTAGAPRVPESLMNQLADGGRLVIPVGSRDRQDLIVVARHGNE